MNEYCDNSQKRPIVTPVGNAWIVCNSDSRPGLKYYFNTLSGESVWNLSPEEIEKAKRFTKALPISEIEKCPEPLMDPPMDHIINPSHAHTDNEPLVRQISNQIPGMIPMGLLDVNNLSRVPNIHGLNPIAWGNPLNNPAMAPTPVIYLAYPQVNFQQTQEYPQNLPTHYNEEHEIYRKQYTNCRENDMFNRSNRVHETRTQSRVLQRNMPQTSCWNNNNNSADLRQKLMRKRCKSVSSESTSLFEHENGSYQDFYTKNRSNNSQTITEETPSKYDLSNLKQLKSSQSNASNWFIVVDTEMVLVNFQVLNKITDPDQDCYLMVPDHVVKKLEMLVSTGGDVQTRRILRFLSQQIEAELAFKGEDLTRCADDEDDTYKMLATCADLAERNNVILLSNNVKYQRFKNDYINVHILTLNELQQILNKVHFAPASLRNKSPTLGIKITVPNHTHRDKIFPTRQTIKTPDIEVQPLIPKKEETIQPLAISSSNITVINNKVLMENTETQFSEKKCDEVDSASKITPEKRPKTSLSNNEDRKEIKLTRSLSVNANSEGTSTRQYRWRKTRNSSTKTTAKSLSVTSEQVSTGSTKQGVALPGSLVSESCSKAILSKPISPTQASSLCQSSISNHDICRPNVIIEETSTSGIISNTTLDSDSMNPSHVKIKKTVSVYDDLDFEMFSVVGPSMEDVLRTRREEWVLRFVQIMEETLKEVLRVDSPFQSRCYDYAPLWAADLPELARCIIKKFSDHFNVVDAANKLSFKLQRISDTGANIDPKQYMEMYSFGVYLIKSLKDVTEDCEDLNSAYESLKSLLYDIQNANLDTGHHDTFADELNDSATTRPPEPAEKLQLEFSDGAAVTYRQNCNNTNTQVNMLTTQQERQINKSSQLSNNETKFFSSLALTKKTIDKSLPTLNSHNAPNTPKIILPPPQASPIHQTSQNSNTLKANTVQNVSPNKDSSLKNDLNTGGGLTSSPITTCFVRNFNSIPQFEEKLNKTQTVCNEGYVDDNYDDAAYDNEYYDQNDELYCDSELEDGEINSEQNENAVDYLQKYPNEVNSSNQPNNNEKFEWFIKEFTDEIRRTIKMVLTLCIKFSEELKNSHGPSQEIKDELKTACESLTSIRNALNSILDSETAPENNIICLLRNANLNEYVPSDELLLDYINIVRKCRDQVDACYEKVTQITKVTGVRKID